MAYFVLVVLVVIIVLFIAIFLIGISIDLFSIKQPKPVKKEIQVETKKDCCCTNGHKMSGSSTITNKEMFLSGLSDFRGGIAVPGIHTEFVCRDCNAVVRKAEGINGLPFQIVYELMQEVYRLKEQLNNKKSKSKV